MLWNGLKAKFEKIQIVKEELLDQIERVVFLRYIMAFGLNFTTVSELTNGVKMLEPNFGS